MEQLIQYIGTGADAATIAIAIVLMRHANRITKIETTLELWLKLQLQDCWKGNKRDGRGKTD